MHNKIRLILSDLLKVLNIDTLVLNFIKPSLIARQTIEHAIMQILNKLKLKKRETT